MWAGGAAVVGLALLLGSQSAFRPLRGDPVAVFAFPAAVMILGAAAVDQRTNRPPVPLAVRLGDASYSLYLIHFGLVTGVFELVVHGGANQAALQPVWAAVAATVVCAVALAFYRLVELPLLGWSRRLVTSGNRP